MADLLGFWSLALILALCVRSANADDPPPEIWAMNWSTLTIYYLIAIGATWFKFNPI